MANKATARNVDFSGVKDGGNFNRKRIPAGDYLAKIIKVEDALAKDKVPQYLFSIKIESRPSSVLPYYCKLQENQFWKLRNLLIAGGISVPKKRFKVDPNKMLGKLIGVSIEDDEYEKDGDTIPQSQVAAVFPAAELADAPAAAETEDDEDEDEDDEDLSDVAGGSEDEEEEPEAEEEEADDEEDEEDVADEYDAMDRSALKAALKARDASFQARKSQSDDDLRTLLRADTEGAEDEEPEEEAPKKPAAAKKSSKKKRPTAEDISDDELDELDIDNM